MTKKKITRGFQLGAKKAESDAERAAYERERDLAADFMHLVHGDACAAVTLRGSRGNEEQASSCASIVVAHTVPMRLRRECAAALVHCLRQAADTLEQAVRSGAFDASDDDDDEPGSLH